MHFAYDATANFYYMGDEPPGPRTYRELLVDRKPLLIAADVETISLKERIAIGIGIAVDPLKCFYFPLFPDQSSAVPWDLLKDPEVTKVYHNGIFDLACMTEYDIDQNIMDTNVMSRLLCNKFNGLSDLGWIHQMETHDAKDVLDEYGVKIMLDLPRDVVARKCMQDAGATLKLYYEFLPRTNLDYFLTEMQTIPIMLKMSERGLLIDHRVRMALELQLEESVEMYREMCEEAEAFNPGSPQQVSYILAKRGAYSVFGRLPFTRNKYGRSTGKLSSDVKVLEKMDDPLAEMVLMYRRNAKLLSTYIKPWAEDARAYTRFHLDAITGRPSSTDRNMQNIPGVGSRGGVNVRAMFLPDTGIWSDMDFSQLELRILAYLSQDRELLHIYETDGDIHQVTAEFLQIDRKIAKNVNFAMVYGGTDETLAETAHIRSAQRAGQLREMWFRLYPQAADYILATQEMALRNPRAKTIFGREMRLPTLEEESRNKIWSKAVDYPCQGSAADILKRGLILTKDMDVALQVHDELLFDGYIDKSELETLEHIAPFKTPIDIKYLERWE